VPLTLSEGVVSGCGLQILRPSAKRRRGLDRSPRHELIQELDHGRRQPFEQDAGLGVQPSGWELAQPPASRLPRRLDCGGSQLTALCAFALPQEPVVARAAAIRWVASASAGVTLCPPFLCTARDLVREARTKCR